MWDVSKDVEVFVVIIGIGYIRIRLREIMVALSYYLWDEKVLELTLKLHFPNAIDMKSMREDYGLVLGFHKMVPFIERYIDLAKKQRDNGTGDKVSIPFAECASRANQTRLTPNEAKSLMRRGGGTVRNK